MPSNRGMASSQAASVRAPKMRNFSEKNRSNQKVQPIVSESLAKSTAVDVKKNLSVDLVVGTGSVLLLVSLGGSRIKFGVPWGEAFKTSTNNTFQKFYLIMWILQNCKEHWFRDCCFPFCRFTSQITAPLGSGVKPVPKKIFHLQNLPGRYIKTAWNTDTCTMWGFLVQVKTFAYIGVLFVALSSSWTKLRREEKKQGNKKRSKERSQGGRKQGKKVTRSAARERGSKEGSREAGNTAR